MPSEDCLVLDSCFYFVNLAAVDSLKSQHLKFYQEHGLVIDEEKRFNDQSDVGLKISVRQVSRNTVLKLFYSRQEVLS